jgi:putative NADH-flavin reductase
LTKPILIMGATSGIGRCAMNEAVRRGLPVRAFARSADTLEATDLVEPFKGDATSAEDVLRALDGARAVVYALGITERLAMLWEEETLFSETTRVLLHAMAQSDVSRLVVVTGFGAGRSQSAMSWIEKTGHRAILGKPYADKDRQEALITASDTDWTIVRPVILTKGARTEDYRVLRDPATWRNGLISRASVAHYLIDAVEQGLDVKADVVLTR